MHETGKQSSLDLKKNMLTLPYIYVINSMDNKDRNRIINKLKYCANKKEIKEIRKIITDLGGIEYTNKKIQEYTDMAKKELEVFPKSKHKDLLIEMLNFNLNRKY